MGVFKVYIRCIEDVYKLYMRVYKVYMGLYKVYIRYIWVYKGVYGCI